MVDYMRGAGGDVELTVYPGAYHAFDASYPVVWLAEAQTDRNCSVSTNVDTLITIDTVTGSRITNVDAYMQTCVTRGYHLGGSEPARSQSRQAVWSFVRQRFGLSGIPEEVMLPAGSTGNHTALWWNPAESGWGVNLNHQGNIVFATLFTYDADRAPLWLVMSEGGDAAPTAVPTGDLYRTTGPAFNANPFTPIRPANLTKVGTMTLAFSDANAATLTTR